MPSGPAAHDVHPCAAALSELANAMQLAVLIAADLNCALEQRPEREDVARLRSALIRAVTATTRLALELYACR